ncbi:hypothetical protein BZZ01_01285 [Nostocales cyanobacterium HT-58-2]|nr:hypothetical protein BZZ01_01285 [Nostocales cyanobacterium HT-58-2]
MPQIHQQPKQRGVIISQRSVSNLLERYDELLPVSLTENQRIYTCATQSTGKSYSAGLFILV